MDAEKGSFVPVAFFSFLCYNACDSLKEEAHITAIENGERITRGLEDGPRRVLNWLELDPWPDEIRSLPLFQNEAAGFSGEDQHSFELKRPAGSGPEGETDFEGTVTDLQTGAARCAGVSLPQRRDRNYDP